jgi:hypothetical protein
VTLAGELLEPDRVDLVSGVIKRVAISARDDDVRTRAVGPTGLEGATESRNVGAESLLRGPRRMFAPQLLDEIVDGHDSTRAGDQAGEDRAFLRSGDRQRIPAFLRDLERPENEEAHGRRLTPVAEDGQTLRSAPDHVQLAGEEVLGCFRPGSSGASDGSVRDVALTVFESGKLPEEACGHRVSPLQREIVPLET